MERKDQRCDQCEQQLKKGRYDKPHHALKEIDTKAIRGSMFGGVGGDNLYLFDLRMGDNSFKRQERHRPLVLELPFTLTPTAVTSTTQLPDVYCSATAGQYRLSTISRFHILTGISDANISPYRKAI